MEHISEKRIVAVMAHPDDAELTCFGTLLRYIQRGYQANVIIVCTGEHGISIRDRQQQGIERLNQSLRYQESLSAFAKTGVQLESLGYEDSNFKVDTALVTDIESRLRALNPEILISHYVDPTGNDHQDHSVVGRACLNASVRCRSIRLILQTEPLQHIRSGFSPNYFVNITEFFERKIKALEAQKSQKGRAYLTREYHLVKGRNNALGAGTWYYEQDLLFESFIASNYVDL